MQNACLIFITFATDVQLNVSFTLCLLKIAWLKSSKLKSLQTHLTFMIILILLVTEHEPTILKKGIGTSTCKVLAMLRAVHAVGNTPERIKMARTPRKIKEIRPKK